MLSRVNYPKIPFSSSSFEHTSQKRNQFKLSSFNHPSFYVSCKAIIKTIHARCVAWIFITFSFLLWGMTCSCSWVQNQLSTWIKLNFWAACILSKLGNFDIFKPMESQENYLSVFETILSLWRFEVHLSSSLDLLVPMRSLRTLWDPCRASGTHEDPLELIRTFWDPCGLFWTLLSLQRPTPNLVYPCGPSRTLSNTEMH